MIFSTAEKLDYTKYIARDTKGIPKEKIVDVFKNLLQGSVKQFYETQKKYVGPIQDFDFDSGYEITDSNNNTSYKIKFSALSPVWFCLDPNIDMKLVIDDAITANFKQFFTSNIFLNDVVVLPHLYTKTTERHLHSIHIDFNNIGWDATVDANTQMKTYIQSQLENLKQYPSITDIAIDCKFGTFEIVNYDTNIWKIAWEELIIFKQNNPNIKIGLISSSMKFLNEIISSNLQLPDFIQEEINIFFQQNDFVDFLHSNNIEVMSNCVFARNLRLNEFDRASCMKWIVSNNITPVVRSHNITHQQELMTLYNDAVANPYTAEEISSLKSMNDDFILDGRIDELYRW